MSDSRRAEAVRAIQRSYGTWATLYDWFARATASVGGVRAGCVAALDLDPGDTVVEFGCGTGANLPPLREAVGADGMVIGVDVTGPMLQRARGLITKRGWENVHLVQGDAVSPPIEAADAVLATFVTSLFETPYDVVSRWCGLGDSVVIANFAPGGNRAANAGLWALTRVDASLFDAAGDDVLDQLESRTEASARALEDHFDRVERERYVLGTITLLAGHRERSDP